MKLFAYIFKTLFFTAYVLLMISATVLSYIFAQDVLGYAGIEATNTVAIVLAVTVFCLFVGLYLVLPDF